MSNVHLTISFYENELNPENHPQFEKHFDEFSNKYLEILTQFDNRFFSNGYVLIAANDHEFDVSTSSFSVHDDNTVNFDRAVCKFLSNVDEIVGIEAYQMFSFGLTPFPEEFYLELFNLLCIGRTLKEEEVNLDKFKDEEFHLLIANVNVDNVEGQYSGSYILKSSGGLKAQFDLYEEEGW